MLRTHATAFTLLLALACKPNTLGESNTGLGEDTSGTDGSAEGDCPVGTEGCSCTAGGGCDPGLMCEGEQCVPTSGDGDPGDGDPGDGDPGDGDPGDGDPGDGDPGDGDPGDGDPDPFICAELDVNECDQPDPQACVCEGCVDDNSCASSEDCVCPDCTNEGFCMGQDDCTDNGECHPFFEGCSCADCVNHPQCI